MDKKILMKIGDKIKIEKAIKWDIADFSGQFKVNHINKQRVVYGGYLNSDCHITNILGDIVEFDFLDMSGKNSPYVTTIQELERIGINTKTEIMSTYKVGDTFTFQDVEMEYKVVGNKDWVLDNDWVYQYKIFKITKTLVYFDGLDYKGPMFLTVRKSDFEKYAIFEKE